MAAHYRVVAESHRRMIVSGLLDEHDVPTWRLYLEDAEWAAREWAKKVTDAELIRAYQQTDGEPGDAEADALLAEIQRRDLDV